MRNGVGFCVTGSPKHDDLARPAQRRRGLGEAQGRGIRDDHDVEPDASGICGTSYGEESQTGARVRSSVGAHRDLSSSMPLRRRS